MRTFPMVVFGACIVLFGIHCAGAQCLPKSGFFPAMQVQGMITCEEGLEPTSVVMISISVDGATCSLSNVEFTYTRGGSPNYALKVWLDERVSHTLVLNMTAVCGGATVGGEFRTAYPAYTVIYFADFQFTGDPTTPWSALMRMPGSFSKVEEASFERLRSDVLSKYPGGRRLLELYRRNIREIADILARDSALRYTTFSLVKQHIPMMMALVSVEQQPACIMSDADFRQVQKLFEGFSLHGTELFHADLREAWTILRSLENAPVLEVLHQIPGDTGKVPVKK